MSEEQTKSGPVRVQLRRTKGWRMPPNTVKVTRPGKYGNPFKIGCNPSEFSTALPMVCETVDAAVACYRYLANISITISGDRWIEPLRGKNLACWCALDKPCHADVLIELANATPEGTEP